MRHWGRALVLIAVALTGCESTQPSTGPSLVAIPTVDVNPNASCAGVGLAAILHGDPTDPEVVWLLPFPGAFGAPAGGRMHVVFPSGYGARFDPTLTIVDKTGVGGLKEGDFIDGACGSGQDGRWLIEPGTDGFALECGPLEVNQCVSGRVAQAARKADAGKRIATIRFVNAGGKFQVLYEDGSTSEGFTSTD